ncbi:4-(cytidine 5'-diphospho)-2-C-methyl-D-erythritol kinase [Halanaerobacter jeridensis]|uniref:4-diphosphocytidyl-2-C-methyl-D-erythritol kinase n=1 Tax=Halanaerobacter jeridensis TaxID=706427 RepID=A0A939BRC3_9FIRM|nr:4-(cytidine 5'-diphospho)-2-C-methyl-D-erythritol kinase [Halanaerobacter jeridensis]MBM7557214.1 4-diphosphocytidyl-2-C-methyl-D-erythritol kinase [Halanaerobacter jeridensis]
MADKLQLKSYAKINLLLDVLGKYENDYHQVEMIMQTIDLYDKLFFTKIDSGINIECKHPGVPSGEKNLIYQAASLLRDEFAVESGLKVKVEKNIPVAAGLAGGSSNAAATLVAVNKLWGLGLNTSELEKRGAELGSDIPFCLAGGTQLATGTGTELEKLELDPKLDLVVVNPPFEVSTAEIYKNLNLAEINCHPQVEKLMMALKRDDYRDILSNLENLLELVAINRYPKIEEIKKIVAAETDRVLMSGSGPTILGFVNSKSKAQEAAASLKQKLDTNYKIVSATTVNTGVELF